MWCYERDENEKGKQYETDGACGKNEKYVQKFSWKYWVERDHWTDMCMDWRLLLKQT